MSYPITSNSWDLKEIYSLRKLIKGNSFTMGSKVKRFENKFKNFFRNFQVITYKRFDFYIRNDWFFHRKTFQLLFRSIEIIFNRKNSLGNIGGKFLERNRFLKLNSFFKNQKIEKRYNNFIKHLIFDFVKEKKFFVFF
jgi:hypothetical protein